MNELHMDALLVSGGYAGERKPVIPVHIILADRIRSLIKSGSLKPGHRFLPTKELAAELKTYPLAVHEAFKILSVDRLIERRSRTGTFVSSNSPVLGSVAIYLAIDIMGPAYLNFYRLVYAELVKLLKDEGVRCSTLLDPRGDDGEKEIWPHLAKSLEKKAYQGIIALLADSPRMKWLDKLGVPIASFCNFQLNREDFPEKSVAALGNKGCSSCGIITNCQADVELSKQVMAAAKRHNMDIKTEWIMMPEKEWIPGPMMERFGYEQFLKLWNLKRRPEGLIVYPDTLLPGIIAAMSKTHVNVPDELKFAIHMNRGSGMLCPFPATFIVSDPRDYALGLIKQIKAKLTGCETAPETVFYEVMEPKTQGEPLCV